MGTEANTQRHSHVGEGEEEEEDIEWLDKIGSASDTIANNNPGDALSSFEDEDNEDRGGSEVQRK
jgi:hypothetical protein